MRILVMRGGAVGDFVLTLPVFRALRTRFPNAGIEILGYPHIAQLASPWVDGIRSIEDPGLAPFFVPNGELPLPWIQYFQAFDVILSYLHDPESVLRSNLERRCLARIVIGSHRPDENGKSHACECLLEPLRDLHIHNADPVPRLKIQQEPAALPELAIHPGSGSQRKNWPWQNWLELISRLLKNSRGRLLLVGGEAESDRWQELQGVLDPNRCDVFFQRPLVDLATRLAQSRFFIGHDSGITHLAAAVGLNGLVLWGPSNPTVWRPRSHRMHLLTFSGGLHQLPVEDVWEALTQHYPPLEPAQ